MIDFNINDNELSCLNREIDIILQEIDILFDTNPKEVLGYEEYGSQYDRYLYNLNASPEIIKSKIISDLQSLNLFGYVPTVDVVLTAGTERDIIFIDIVLTKNNENYRKIYKIV